MTAERGLRFSFDRVEFGNSALQFCISHSSVRGNGSSKVFCRTVRRKFGAGEEMKPQRDSSNGE